MSGSCAFRSMQTPVWGYPAELQMLAPRSEERAKKEMVFPIHFTVFIQVDPPAAAEMTRLSGAEFRMQSVHVRYQLLESPFLRQGIGDDDRIVVQALRCHKNHRAGSPSGGAFFGKTDAA